MTTLNTTPHYAAASPTIRRVLAIFLVRLRRLVNRWVAATLAHRERQATLVVLRHLSDRDLKDIGIHRSDLGDSLAERAKVRERMQQSHRC